MINDLNNIKIDESMQDQKSAKVEDADMKMSEEGSSLMKVSQVLNSDMEKIAYTEMLDNDKLLPLEYRLNMENMMHMGFTDYKKNFQIL